MDPAMPMIFAMFGTMDLVIIGFIALLLFGNRLPTMMRSLGQGVTEFKKGVAGIEDDRDESRPNDGGRKIDDSRKTTEERPA
jgi:sec-independent protein translocase protein TatA